MRILVASILATGLPGAATTASVKVKGIGLAASAIERSDLELGPILRIYEPDLEAMKSWTPPVASCVEG
jgi:hypothetical protein